MCPLSPQPAPWRPPEGPLPVIVDADPALLVRAGLDIDDDLAILFALGSPEVEVRGLTVTYGNTSITSAFRDARDLLRRAGREEIPVRKGAGWLDRRSLKETDASRFLADVVCDAPGEVLIVTLGPLTNLAAALRACPDIARRARGHLALGGRLTSGRREFNFSAHPEAVDRVLSTAMPRVFIPIDVCLPVLFTRTELRQVQASHGTVLKGLEPQLRSFLHRKRILHYLHRLRGRRTARDGFHPWDVVAVAWLVRPDLFRTPVPMHFRMEERRVICEPCSHAAPCNCAQVPRLAAPEAVLRLIVERLLRTKAPRSGPRVQRMNGTGRGTR